MFISKSSHKASLSLKDAEIATLRSEVAFLRSLVTGLTVYKTPSLQSESVAIEANALLSGAQEQIDLNEVSQQDPSEIAEAVSILSGTY